MNERKVFSIELHAAVNFGGFVGGTLTAKNDYKLTLIEEAQGIIIRGPKCYKLIPWAAFKGVDFYNEDGTSPVSPKSKI